MYLKLNCKITIGGKYLLRGVNNIEIKKSVHQLIQTAKVVLPLSLVTRNNNMLTDIKITDKIKEGDSIKIEFGYNGNYELEFYGFIKRINYTSPIELECEDELYLFRKTYYKKSFRKCTLKELIEFLLVGLNDNTGLKLQVYEKMPEMSFSNFIINEANGIDVLQELKDKHKVNIYLTEVDGLKTLYAGLAYSLEKDRVKYEVDRNIISTDSLKYEASGDKKYLVKITANQKDGSKLKVQAGDAGGDETTINLPGHCEKDLLQHMANSELQKKSTAGYKGSFETFLIPHCEPGTIAEISDKQFPERKGKYFIGTVTTTFGTGGGRRKPEADLRISK